MWLGARVLVASCSVLLCLAAGEVGVRMLGMAPPALPIWLSEQDSPDVVFRRSQNPLLGFELKPDYRHPDPDFQRSFARTNAHGQRDLERSTRKPPGVRRIVVLGDSVVLGHGLRDVDQTISRQLEALYPDGRTEVLNFGVSGYSTRSEVELLESKALAFQPDVVILVFVENDFDNFSPESFRAKSAFERPEWVKRLFVASQLFRLLCVRLDLFHFGVDADPLAWNRQAIGDNNVVAGFARLRELALEHGFEPIVAIWPDFGVDEVRNEHPVPGDPERLLVERLAAMYGLPTVRLSDWFRRDLAAQPPGTSPRSRYSFQADGLHPNRESAQKAARALREVVAEVDSGQLALNRAPVAREDLAAIDAALRVGQESEPGYAVAYAEAGIARQRAGDFDAAARFYRRSLDADPGWEPALYNLGVVLVQQGRLREAAEHLERALRTMQARGEVHYTLGVVYTSLGEPENAVPHLQQAIRQLPGAARAHRDYGVALARTRQLPEAEAALQRALLLAPDDPAVHYYLGDLQARAGRLDEAEVSLRQAIALDPTLADAHGSLGVLLLDQRRFSEAAAFFERRLALEPNSEQARAGLAAARAAE